MSERTPGDEPDVPDDDATAAGDSPPAGVLGELHAAFGDERAAATAAASATTTVRRSGRNERAG